MTWEWSHTQEAYDSLRDRLERMPRDFLETVFAEWKAQPGGFFPPRGRVIISTAGFDDRRYERALAAAKHIPTEKLAERIYKLAERQSDCTNGGHEAHVCPYHCGPHTIDWDDTIRKGERVRVRKHRSKPGKGLSYEIFHGELLEDCNGEGWDVVEIRADNESIDEPTSVYSFSVERE